MSAKKKLNHFFVLDQSFFNQQTFKDKERQFKKLVEECWFISDNLHTSYIEARDLSVTERTYLIDFINKKFKKQKEAIEEIKNKKSS